MTDSKKPKSSSYDRVNQHFLGLPAWRELVSRVREALARGPVKAGVHFEYGQVHRNNHWVYEGRSCYFAEFDIPWGSDAMLTVTSSEKDSFDLGSRSFHDKMFDPVFEAHFGVSPPNRRRPHVPTYNCKKDKALESFRAFARCALYDAVEADIDAARRATIAKWSTHSAEEIEAGKTEACHLQAIEEIKNQVLKWIDRVPASVIKAALDEVVCHQILES